MVTTLRYWHSDTLFAHTAPSLARGDGSYNVVNRTITWIDCNGKSFTRLTSVDLESDAGVEEDACDAAEEEKDAAEGEQA